VKVSIFWRYCYIAKMPWRILVLTLDTYLENANKSFLNATHKRINTGGGLVQNTKIKSDVRSWALDSERIQQALQALDSHEKTVLMQIYFSTGRGVSVKELRRQNTRDASWYQNVVNQLCWDLLIYKTSNSQEDRYCGFVELYDEMLNLARSTDTYPEHTLFSNMSGFFVKHLSVFCAYLLQNRAKINAEGVLYRRIHQKLDALIPFGATIHSTVPAQERDLVLRCLLDMRLMAVYQDELRDTPLLATFLSHPMPKQHLLILEWWLHSHGLEENTLHMVLQAFEFGISAKLACDLFWVYEARPLRQKESASGAVSWTHLPIIIQELYLLGLLEFSTSPDGIHGLQLTPFGHDALQTMLKSYQQPEINPPVGTPDFEILVPIQSHASYFFLLEMVAESLSDDIVCRYRIHRDTFIQGIANPIVKERLSVIYDIFSDSASVQSSLKDWYNTVFCSRLFRPLLFHVSDQSKFTELCEMDGIQEYIVETIPNYGFVLQENTADKFIELISHLGLEPPAMLDGSDIVPAPAKSSPAEWSAHPLLQTRPYYPEQAPEELEASTYATGKKYSDQFQTLGYSEIIQVVRYAGVMEMDVEVKLTEKEEILRLSNVQVNNFADPPRIRGINSENQDAEAFIENIAQIRILEAH
jgi:hypothetical protein